MSCKIKICGLNYYPAVEAAIEYGATYFGCVFNKSAVNYITPIAARDLFIDAPHNIQKVAVISNPKDRQLDEIIKYFKPDYIQLDSQEKPLYLAMIKARLDCKIIKSIELYTKKDIRVIDEYEEFADMFLFRPSIEYLDPHSSNQRSFDWRILREIKTKKEWMASGNISKHNVNFILRESQAQCIDVSSSLESALGLKDPVLIKNFLESVQGLVNHTRY